MGYIAFPRSFDGKKIVRIHDVNTESTVGATGISGKERHRLPASYLIPEDDPQFSKEGNTALGRFGYMLNSRCWIYDAGLALLVFTISGDYELCREMLDRLCREQNKDGSFNFSYDSYIGQLFEGYVRTGAVGWLVHGMCYYTLKTGDRQYLDMIRRAGDFLLTRLITDKTDRRYGLLTGGYGGYDAEDYSYIEEEVEWCSTEHNCSALQAISDLALIFGDRKYKKAAAMIKKSLFETLYDRENDRFYQGVSQNGVDDAWALDCCTWAGKTLLSVIESQYSRDIAQTVREVYATSGKSIAVSTEKEHYNTRYSGGPFAGMKPYAAGYQDPPDIVWSEGTLGHAALLQAIGETEEAEYYLDEIIRLQNCEGSTGGVLYVTETRSSLPWEFHAWESLVSSAWLYILIKEPNALFPITSKVFDPLVMAGNGKGRSYGIIEQMR